METMMKMEMEDGLDSGRLRMEIEIEIESLSCNKEAIVKTPEYSKVKLGSHQTQSYHQPCARRWLY